MAQDSRETQARGVNVTSALGPLISRKDRALACVWRYPDYVISSLGIVAFARKSGRGSES